ncbi:hypothetical protein LL936_11050 [Levilactobacillus brevis]|uniref:Mobilization protein n=1 Tax=Ligilactobacillus acidipiscis TaxID=89059 RepID=A0A285PJ65_9LACO|nr:MULTISPECIES: hypothetical protein [Lactobacillaceae]MBU7449263.1 hypothetical protein [Lactiplantibacillus sp. 7.2.4]MBU7462594.1 hypothetical protein [Lactiplantibacillus pentosus]MBU7465949.1 hypothetical protein [Lactiplantibacillus pentosus]MBU7481692.1 hypothetical protein [Lactiplantibacillus pentosus]MBU7491816.1 hypothetical protein [Lactiplantibacillus pentosus]
MNVDKKLFKQIYDAYDDNQIDFNNVPAFKELVEQAAQEQMAQVLNTTELEKKQQALLDEEQAWYHQEAEKMLKEKRRQLDNPGLHFSVYDDLRKYKQHATDLQAELKQQEKQFHEAEKKAFWQHAMVTLLAIANSLILVCLVLFVLKTLLYDGIWRGWGFYKLYNTVWALHTDHYIGSIILGIVGFIGIGIAIAFSFWCALQMTHYLTDFKLSRLKFWKKDKMS